MRKLSYLALALLSTITQAQTLSGHTADGCTYKVINGQYLTNCPARGAQAQDQITTASASPAPAAEPVTNYSDVPLRQNSQAPLPSVSMPGSTAPSTMTVALSAPPVPSLVAEEQEDTGRARLRNRLLDKTYVGALLGANNVKEANTGGNLGMGLNLGTNIDENFGIEVAYTYAKQDLNLGLASRVNSQPASGTASDSTLFSHLFTAEIQGHLTDPLKRLRPYLGLGLGWKTSTLDDNAPSPSAYGYPSSKGNGSLHQSTLGGIGSAGTKLRLGRAVQLAFAFRYFFPLSKQNPRLEQPANAFTDPTNATRLTSADSALTGSSQYQLLGGLQYLF